MARPTLAIRSSRNCANYKMLLSFILSKGYKVRFLKSFDKKSDVSVSRVPEVFSRVRRGASFRRPQAGDTSGEAARKNGKTGNRA